jgi:hypothetical protein
MARRGAATAVRADVVGEAATMALARADLSKGPGKIDSKVEEG